MTDDDGTFHIGGNEPVYFKWCVKKSDRWWRVIRHGNGEARVIGEHFTLGQAWAAMDADRMPVLSDPLAIEFKKPDVRPMRGMK